MEIGGAESGAVGADCAPIDADLQAIIDAWPALSARVKAEIVALARRSNRGE